MLFKESTEEQTEVLDEVLLVIFPVGVGQPNVGVQRQHLHRYGDQIEVLISIITTRNVKLSQVLSEAIG